MAHKRCHPDAAPAAGKRPEGSLAGALPPRQKVNLPKKQTHPGGYGHRAAVGASGRAAARPGWPTRPPAPAPAPAPAKFFLRSRESRVEYRQTFFAVETLHASKWNFL